MSSGPPNEAEVFHSVVVTLVGRVVELETRLRQLESDIAQRYGFWYSSGGDERTHKIVEEHLSSLNRQVAAHASHLDREARKLQEVWDRVRKLRVRFGDELCPRCGGMEQRPADMRCDYCDNRP